MIKATKDKFDITQVPIFLTNDFVFHFCMIKSNKIRTEHATQKTKTVKLEYAANILVSKARNRYFDLF